MNTKEVFLAIINVIHFEFFKDGIKTLACPIRQTIRLRIQRNVHVRTRAYSEHKTSLPRIPSMRTNYYNNRIRDQ